jgi:alpha-methylacyl-CoA racemase
VLSLAEAPAHAHHAMRGTFITVDGSVQPAPAPRFSRTVPSHPTPPEKPDSRAALEGWMTAAEIDALDEAGTI